jgi:hypothetical protein
MRLDVPSARIKVSLPGRRIICWLGKKHAGGTRCRCLWNKQIPMYHSTWHHIAEGHYHKVNDTVLEQWKKQN